jgi:hypothetical protein
VAREESLGYVGRGGIFKQQKTVTSKSLGHVGRGGIFKQQQNGVTLVAREESLGHVGRGGIFNQQKTVSPMGLEKSPSAMWAEVKFSIKRKL